MIQRPKGYTLIIRTFPRSHTRKRSIGHKHWPPEQQAAKRTSLQDHRGAPEVLPRRWVVERTLAWITSHRRCARDYERPPASHEAMVLWAMIALMTQRLAHTPD